MFNIPSDYRSLADLLKNDILAFKDYAMWVAIISHAQTTMPKEDNILFLQKRIAYARDEQAYKKFFFHFYTPLHRLCFGIIKDAETAEELVSDLMIKMWLMGPKLMAIENPKLYLFKAIRNASYTYLSKSKLTTLPLIEEQQLPEYMLRADEKLELSEVQLEIEAAISSLPPKSQLVFRLIKEESFSYNEVAEILGITINTIKTHIRIAFQHIRQALHASSEK